MKIHSFTIGWSSLQGDAVICEALDCIMLLRAVLFDLRTLLSGRRASNRGAQEVKAATSDPSSKKRFFDEESRLDELVRREALSGISSPEALSREQNDLVNTVAQAFRVPTSQGLTFQDPRAPQLSTGARSGMNQHKALETQSTSLPRPPPSLLQAFGASATAASRAGCASPGTGASREKESEGLSGGNIRDKYLNKLRQKTVKANRGGVAADGVTARRLVEQMDEASTSSSLPADAKEALDYVTWRKLPVALLPSKEVPASLIPKSVPAYILIPKELVETQPLEEQIKWASQYFRTNAIMVVSDREDLLRISRAFGHFTYRVGDTDGESRGFSPDYTFPSLYDIQMAVEDLNGVSFRPRPPI